MDLHERRVVGGILALLSIFISNQIVMAADTVSVAAFDVKTAISPNFNQISVQPTSTARTTMTAATGTVSPMLTPGAVTVPTTIQFSVPSVTTNPVISQQSNLSTNFNGVTFNTNNAASAAILGQQATFTLAGRQHTTGVSEQFTSQQAQYTGTMNIVLGDAHSVSRSIPTNAPQSDVLYQSEAGSQFGAVTVFGAGTFVANDIPGFPDGLHGFSRGKVMQIGSTILNIGTSPLTLDRGDGTVVVVGQLTAVKPNEPQNSYIRYSAPSLLRLVGNTLKHNYPALYHALSMLAAAQVESGLGAQATNIHRIIDQENQQLAVTGDTIQVSMTVSLSTGADYDPLNLPVGNSSVLSPFGRLAPKSIEDSIPNHTGGYQGNAGPYITEAQQKQFKELMARRESMVLKKVEENQKNGRPKYDGLTQDELGYIYYGAKPEEQAEIKKEFNRLKFAWILDGARTPKAPK